MSNRDGDDTLFKMDSSMLTLCTSLHSIYDLKATQMNEQHSLIQKLMIYKFKLGYNAADSTRNDCCVIGQGAVDHSTITR